MTFFQNSNTLTSPIPSAPALSAIGFDSIPAGISTDWGDFLSNPIHSERREAFKEFVYLMVYHRNRELENVKFPHNVLFEKVLKFYVETQPSATGSGFPIPINAVIPTPGPIFLEVTTSGVPVFNPINPATNILANKPVLRGEGASSIPNIKLEVNIALATGNTSVGFFQEAATLFAHFYLFRQLTIFNGHTFEFSKTLGSEIVNGVTRTISKVISKAIDEDTYLGSSFPPATASAIVRARTNRIMGKVNLPPSSRPYYFNSLFDNLIALGFQIPSTPLSTPPVGGLSFWTTEHQKIFLAYFVKLLDPTRFMGVTISPAPSTAGVTTTSGAIFTIPAIFDGIPSGSGFEKKNAITSDPYSLTGGIAGAFEKRTKNSFIQDLFVTIRSGNGTNPDFGSAGGSSYPLPKMPFFANGTGLPFSNPPQPLEIYAIVQKVFEDLKDTTQKAIQSESQAMLTYFFGQSGVSAENTILASGIGETTVSILGIRNFGLPFFNYKMASNSNLSRENSASSSVSLKKREAIHIGVYALDLFYGPPVPSSFNVKVDLTENYQFSFIPEPLSTGLTGDIKITAVSIPYSSTTDFYNVYNSSTQIWSYYRRLPRVGSSSLGVPELVAEYLENQRDLIFREFSDYEIASVYDFNSVYSSPNSKPIEYKVKSSFIPSNLVTEELLTLISVYPDVYPGIISDDSLYNDDTFQLSGTFAAGLSLNGLSFNRLLTSTNEEQGLQLIFNLIEDGAYAVDFLPPVLSGSYVGQVPTTGISAVGGSSLITADTSYTPKYSAGTNSEVPNGQVLTPAQKATFKVIKYSWGQFTLTQIPAYPAIPTTIEVGIEIKSFVNPSESQLQNNINPTSSTFPINGTNKTPAQILSDKKTGGAVNNQVLAMLRSFGLLEGIVEKMKLKATGHPAETAILLKLENWLPPAGSTAADGVICLDENLLGATVLVDDVRLSEYYALKIP